MIRRLRVVPQQARRLVHIHDQKIEVTVIVEISSGASTAGMAGADSRSSFLDQFLKLAISQVSIENARRTEGIFVMARLQLGVDAAGGYKEVRPAVIVKVRYHGAPSHVAGLNS